MANGIANMKGAVRLYIWNEGETAKVTDRLTGIMSIGDIGGSVDEIEQTDFDSLAKEFIKGLADSGSFEISQKISAGSSGEEYKKALERYNSVSNISWGIAIGSGETAFGIQGAGYVQSPTLGGLSVSGIITVTSGIRVSGAITADFVEPTPTEPTSTAPTNSAIDVQSMMKNV